MAHRETLDARFAEYVTRVAFDLNLSRGQITALAIVKYEADRDMRRLKLARKRRPRQFSYENLKDRPRYSHFVPAIRGLLTRGLVTWTDPSTKPQNWDEYPYRLTRAGELVFQLLEVAGLVRDASDYDRKVAA